MRRKLFLFMIMLSVIPNLIITSISSYSAYQKIYEDTVAFNLQGIHWAHDRLEQLTQEMKNLFYSMEFNPLYKGAILNWYDGSETVSDRSQLRDVLVTLLNQQSFLQALRLYVAHAEESMVADRAQVIIIPREGKHIFFSRPSTMQTNIFFKQTEEGIFAIHNIHRFIDRQLLAQQSARIKEDIFRSIISETKVFETEAMYIINDEMEIIAFDTKKEYPLHPDVLRSNSAHYYDDEGTLYFYSHTPQSKLSIIKIVPKRELVATVMPTIYTAIIIGVISIFGSLFLSILLSRYLSRPVEQLAHRVRSIELQHLVLETEDQTANEIRTLEHAISLFVQRIRELIRSEYEAKLLARTAQLHALQAQINPHFLHNTLQLIGSLSLAAHDPKAYRITSALSSLMRYCIDFESEEATIEEELHHLDDYILIQQTRFSDRLIVEKHIDEAVLPCIVPKLLLQPIVENSFTHGFSSQLKNWHLTISAHIDTHNIVHIVIKDNGVGLSSEQVDLINQRLSHTISHSSIGLQNVFARIRMKFSETDGLELRSLEGSWTEVHMFFTQRVLV